uniref:Lysozyme n=2 Tax=Heterodera glycines TaxID=51029 RepID=A0A6C0N3J0_HETGL|nr:lysozyme [Heterodera glycines]
MIAISKAIQGNAAFIDRRFVENFKGMKEANIPTRLAYHYFEGGPNSASAKEQAEHFIRTLDKAGFDPGKDFIVIDVEKDCNKGAVKSEFSEKLVELVKLLKEKVPAKLYIYTNRDGWNSLVDTEHDDFFEQYPLWGH